MSILPFRLLAACHDNTLQITNSEPEANIIDPQDGAVVLEGEILAFQGMVNDMDGAMEDLLTTWSTGERNLCPPSMPDAEGLALCRSSLREGESTVRLLVTDVKGSTGDDAIELVVTPTQTPTATILQPTATGDYSSDVAVAFEGVVADAEDLPGDLLVAWQSDVDGVLATGGQAPDSDGRVLGTSLLSQGTHTIYLTVTDTLEKTGQADPVIIEVGPPAE